MSPSSLFPHRAVPEPSLPYNWKTFSPSARLIYILYPDAANEAVSLMSATRVGFDLEWKPSYRKGQAENPVALVQLATDDRILLIHISFMKEFPEKLRQLLENPRVLKAGVGIQYDAEKLFRDYNISMRGCVDLSLLARTVDNARWKGPYKSSIGLARLIEAYESRTLGKGKVRRSNWQRMLNESQQEYAGNDAHASFYLYIKLDRMKDIMEITPESECFTFNCIEGRLREPSGTLWFPYNPEYDPGPVPPKQNATVTPEGTVGINGAQLQNTALVESKMVPITHRSEMSSYRFLSYRKTQPVSSVQYKELEK
ncbi:hypothetical protein AX17_000167 [Amanita inopinata Kibby_2008]|nr:hypothetical protein AX17_000167 [Amanita inopinata Kibby_2008]